MYHIGLAHPWPFDPLEHALGPQAVACQICLSAHYCICQVGSCASGSVCGKSLLAVVP